MPSQPKGPQEYARVDELTNVQAIEAAHVIERAFSIWWQDNTLRPASGEEMAMVCGAAFSAGFNLARQLFLRESFTDPGPAPSNWRRDAT